MKQGALKQVGVHIETGRHRKSTKVQSSHCGEGLPTEERSGFRRDLCPGSDDDIHPDGAEYIGKHGPRGRVVRCEDGILAHGPRGGDLDATTGRIHQESS